MRRGPNEGARPSATASAPSASALNTSLPRRKPLSIITGNFLFTTDDFGQHFKRRRTVVHRAATVIRHDDAVNAFLDADFGIFSSDDAFQNDGVTMTLRTSSM